MTRIIVRSFLQQVLQAEERVTLKTAREEKQLIPKLAEKHAEAMGAGRLDMIEIEFLDVPDINERFFRLGTNPAGMVIPIGLKL
jgi:hypothetical protein